MRDFDPPLPILGECRLSDLAAAQTSPSSLTASGVGVAGGDGGDGGAGAGAGVSRLSSIGSMSSGECHSDIKI